MRPFKRTLLDPTAMTTSDALKIHLCFTLRVTPSRVIKDWTKESSEYKFYDIKFFPWQNQFQGEPILAIVGYREVLICNISSDESGPILRILSTVRDLEDLPDNSAALLNSCEWNYITSTSAPLLTITGSTGLIKVLDPLTGSEFTTLVGHGVGTVNDLATHPQHPYILASASLDCSIRIWDLRRTKAAGNENPKEKPCIIICGHGQSHKDGLITVNWHSTGRYIVAAGHDHMISIWTIPDLSDSSPFWDEISHPPRHSDRVKVIHYPHFITAAVHDNYVDHVQFYGDLILSKSCSEEETLVLWKVEGFNSRKEPPGEDAAPKTKEYLDTRSGFMPRPSKETTSTGGHRSSENKERLWPPTAPPPWSRLLSFHIPGSLLFFSRFGLSLPSPAYPDIRPTLAYTNLRSRVSLWDLAALEDKVEPRTREAMEDEDDPEDRPRSSGRGAAGRGGSTPSRSGDNTMLGPNKRIRTKHALHDPFKPMEPHHTIQLSDFKLYTQWGDQFGFQGRGTAWSPDGRWCVAVGEYKNEACAALFERQ